MIQPIKGVEKVNEVISGGNVIIGVSAPWCGYCRRLRPILEKISEELMCRSMDLILMKIRLLPKSTK